MACGNKLGVDIDTCISRRELVAKDYGSIILEIKPEQVNTLGIPVTKIGTVNDTAVFTYGEVSVTMDEALAAWTKTLENVFPTESGVAQQKIETGLFDAKTVYTAKKK